MSDSGPNDEFKKLVAVEGHSQVIYLEGTKKDQGKPAMSLIPSDFLIELAKVLSFGAQKYDPHNWRKGIKWSRMIDAAMRHITAWKEGEDLDAESGLSHLAHASCCLAFLVSYEKRRREFDDRYKQVVAKEIPTPPPPPYKGPTSGEPQVKRSIYPVEAPNGEGTKKNDN